MSAGNYIHDENRVTHFSMIPHLIDDMGLTPYAVRLYVRLKRRVSQNEDGSTSGEAFETTKNLAQACRMSTGQVSKAKKELKAAGLIRVKKVPGKHGEWPNDHITIVDIWNANKKFYSNDFTIIYSDTGEVVARGEDARRQVRSVPEWISNHVIGSQCEPDASRTDTDRATE